MDVKEMREAFNKWLDGNRPSGVEKYENGFFAGYKAALSTLDPEAQGQAASVGKHFCAAMPCSPSDCGEVPCQYMRDAIANRNNHDPEAIKRTVLLDAIKSISILNQMSVESSINDDYLIGYGFGVRDCQIKLESILPAEPGQEKDSP